MDLSDTEKLELEVRRLRAENAALLADPRTSPIADIARVCMEAVRACDEKLDDRGLCSCCKTISTFLLTWRSQLDILAAALDTAEAKAKELQLAVTAAELSRDWIRGDLEALIKLARARCKHEHSEGCAALIVASSSSYPCSCGHDELEEVLP